MRSCVDHRLPSNTCLSRGHHKNLSKVGLSRYSGRASASRVKATSDDELYPPKLRKLMDSFNLVRSFRHIRNVITINSRSQTLC